MHNLSVQKATGALIAAFPQITMPLLISRNTDNHQHAIPITNNADRLSSLAAKFRYFTGIFEVLNCDRFRHSSTQMREELVAAVERARKLMQGGGETNVLPAGKGGQEQTPCES